jgi:hypothetical protein
LLNPDDGELIETMLLGKIDRACQRLNSEGEVAVARIEQLERCFGHYFGLRQQVGSRNPAREQEIEFARRIIRFCGGLVDSFGQKMLAMGIQVVYN